MQWEDSVMNIFRGTALALLASVLAWSAHAQDYPNRPVRIIVPSTAGGGYDFVGRLLGDQLARHIGGSYVVENLTGSGTLVGTRQAVKASPDGYTLLIGGLSNIIHNMGLYTNPGYDSKKDLIPIGVFYSQPFVLIARKDLPYKTVDEIVAAMRAKPGAISVATAGPGTGQDVLASIFTSVADAKITKVPYRGSGPVYPDLMAGRVDLFFDAMSSAQPQIEAGNVRMVATLATKRSPGQPDTPTMAEAGFPDLTLEQGNWFGLFAPIGTPEPIIQKLREGIAKTLNDQGFKERVAASGGEILMVPSAQVQGVIDRDSTRWLEQMRKAGIQPAS